MREVLVTSFLGRERDSTRRGGGGSLASGGDALDLLSSDLGEGGKGGGLRWEGADRGENGADVHGFSKNLGVKLVPTVGTGWR